MVWISIQNFDSTAGYHTLGLNVPEEGPVLTRMHILEYNLLCMTERCDMFSI